MDFETSADSAIRLRLENSEEFQEAANTMFNAAKNLRLSVDKQDTTIAAFMEFMDGWMDRFESAVTRMGKQ